MEVNEETARMRRRASIIQCADESERATRTNAVSSSDLTRECHDCGNHLLSCRCNPGEG